jgi:hypothetical protein
MSEKHYYVECCFVHQQTEFWVPVLKTGLQARDLATAIKLLLIRDLGDSGRQKFAASGSEVYVAHHTTCVPLAGKAVVLPGQAVRVWVVPENAPMPGYALTSGSDCEWAQKTSTTYFNDWLTAGEGAFAGSDRSESSGEEEDKDRMPFHAVRVGHTPGIYFTKGDMLKQTANYPGAESKTFSSLTEATLYLEHADEGVGERELMSAGSRARHPPAKSAAIALSSAGTEMESDPGVDVHMVQILWDCVFDPVTKTGYLVVALHPGSLHRVLLPNVQNAGRCEVVAADTALTTCLEKLAGITAQTVIRIYSSSTYATNAVNVYARSTAAGDRHNGDVMLSLANKLRGHKIMAYWAATTQSDLAEVRAKAVAFRLQSKESVEADP